MNVPIKIRWLKKLQKMGGSSDFGRIYEDDNRTLQVDHNKLTDKDFKLLQKIVSKDKVNGKPAKGCRAYRQRINLINSITEEVSKAKITALQPLVDAIKIFMDETKHRFLFKLTPDGNAVPYYVARAVHDIKNEYHNERVEITLLAAAHGGRVRDTLHIEYEDIKRTLPEILEAKGYIKETEAHYADYEESLKRFQELAPQVGLQCVVDGMVKFHEYYDDWKHVPEDGLNLFVLDHMSPEMRESEGSTTSDNDFYVDEEEEDREVVALPVHPYIYAFDLETHEFVEVHANSLEVYDYDPSLYEKLILPPATKKLISFLLEGSSAKLDDIIAGKSGGINILTTGEPGTGKTLTAEVFSEQVKRALYRVQCSQLGISAEELETNLKKVMQRNIRWKSLLLIDEADVYVHRRGTDLEQNAIVGVWLRLLERSSGIIFLTTNRETIVDDAIMSRMTAWIQYHIPTSEDLKKIWKVLSSNYRVKLSAGQISELCERLPRIAGRDVKNLLKLSVLWSLSSNKSVSVGDIVYLSSFLKLSADHYATESTDTTSTKGKP